MLSVIILSLLYTDVWNSSGSAAALRHLAVVYSPRGVRPDCLVLLRGYVPRRRREHEAASDLSRPVRVLHSLWPETPSALVEIRESHKENQRKSTVNRTIAVRMKIMTVIIPAIVMNTTSLYREISRGSFSISCVTACSISSRVISGAFSEKSRLRSSFAALRALRCRASDLRRSALARSPAPRKSERSGVTAAGVPAGVGRGQREGGELSAALAAGADGLAVRREGVELALSGGLPARFGGRQGSPASAIAGGPWAGCDDGVCMSVAA